VTIQLFTPPYGQSFIPTLTSIGFVKLQFSDENAGNALGATLYVNLRTGTVSGPLLGSTVPVAMTDGFVGIATFLFSAPLSLTPGVTYFLEPVVQSGDSWNINGTEYGYPDGSFWYGGNPQLASDLWFREGIVVPEPSSLSLVALSSTLLFVARNR